MRLKITIDKIIFIIMFIVGFVGLVFYSNSVIMYGVIGLECSLLFICLLTGKNDIFHCLLVAFIVMSQEFAYFLEDGTSSISLYSFKETRVLGLNLGLIFTGAFFGKIILFDNALNRVNRKGEGYKLVRWLVLLLSFSLIVGAFNILTNNNGIGALPNVWKIFIQEWSYGLFVTILAFNTIFVIDNYGFFLVERTILGLMVCNLILPILADLVGVVGYYGGKELYLTLSSYMLCTFILIFPCYSRYKHKQEFFCGLFGIGVVFPLLCRSMAFGKLLLIVAFVVILFLFLKSMKSPTWFLTMFVVAIAIVCGWRVLINTLIKNNDLFGYKYKQVLSLISIWNDGWYENMLPSPKVRITEFLNICIELIKNPIYLFIGKGTLGTVKDYMGQIEAYNLSIYSYNEFSIGAFYGVHESINIFLLSNGILGVCFLLKYFKLVIINIKNNPYVIIGAVWILLLWGYSNTRATLGIICLCLGLSMLNKHYNINGEMHEYK